jgi:hypothetical protein
VPDELFNAWFGEFERHNRSPRLGEPKVSEIESQGRCGWYRSSEC